MDRQNLAKVRLFPRFRPDWGGMVAGLCRGMIRALRTVRAYLLKERQSPVQDDRRVPAIAAALIFFASLVYYGLLMFPGLGGVFNPGDSTKFQILGHTPIMPHGPGYPTVLLLGTAVRALGLPLPPWWAMTFALSVLPAAVANAMAVLIVHRLTRHVLVAIAAGLLLGTSSLMAIQATEAEVYALNLAFILTTLFFLVLFVQTRRVGFFVTACAVYALSFGNHLMMVMLLPVFVWLTATHFRLILRPRPIAAILFFILVGASQYLYLAYAAYDPNTAYSEYMPLPPRPEELLDYIFGTYFGTLYGAGLASTQTLEALAGTLLSAHPWISAPLIIAGLVCFATGWKRRDADWRGLALVYGAALSFAPFMLWYGAYDIRAFHLPVLGPLLIAAAATLAWRLAYRPALVNGLALVLLAIGAVRTEQIATLLSNRTPVFENLRPTIRQVVAQAPLDNPLVVMSYELRMATLYYELAGQLPRTPTYRVWWHAIPEIKSRADMNGVVVPTDGFQFVHWIEHERPELRCATREVPLQADTRWPAYVFTCDRDPAVLPGDGTLKVSFPAPYTPEPSITYN
ncbi:ArnT family glycosyltransferase [Pelagibacterium halotolerans]|uniref:ArnT family glycosyltransferase n=1 Tax=Pelagibacterium halotolerans TaxID=531813 RepID=UPI00384E3D71